MRRLAVLPAVLLFLSACQLQVMPEQAEVPAGPTVVQAEPTAVEAESTVADVESPDQVLRISLADAKRHFDQDSALFVDSRSPAAFAQHHIPGAISLPVSTEITGSELPKDRLIITYCT